MCVCVCVCVTATLGALSKPPEKEVVPFLSIPSCPTSRRVIR